MHNVKCIVTVGTSFTAGGGFEENSILRPIMNKWEPEPLPASMFECSWPGQLKKLIKPEIKLINLGMPGAGYEYMIRITEDWIANNPDPYELERTLFLLETSALGRSEFWDAELGQHIVCNWEQKGDRMHASLHSGQYWKDSPEKIQAINKNEDLMSEWLTKFIGFEQFLEKAESSQFNFFCKLNYLGHKFAHFGTPFTNPVIEVDPLIKSKALYLEHKGRKYTSIHEYLDASKLTITDFTHGEAVDFHASLKGNLHIAHFYYAQLKQLYNI